MHYYVERAEGSRIDRALLQYNRRMRPNSPGAIPEGELRSVWGRRKRYLAAVAAGDRSRVDPAALWVLVATASISNTSAQFRLAMDGQGSLMRSVTPLVKEFGYDGTAERRLLKISDNLLGVNSKYRGLLGLSRQAQWLYDVSDQFEYTFLGLERVIELVKYFDGDDSALAMAARFVDLDAKSRPLVNGEDMLSRYEHVERSVERVVCDSSDGIVVEC